MAKTVLITGVAGGIGQSTANLFSDRGWHVIGVDKQEADIKGVSHFIQADVSSKDACDRVFETIDHDEGRLDALVNNAAIQICKSVVNLAVKEWDATMATNLRSVFLMVQRAYPLLQPGGAIVNVSSVHARATSSGISAYAASKGGLLAFTRSLAIEFADKGIRVNAVLPGAIDTNMLRDGLQRGHASGDSIAERVQSLGSRHVIGRVGTPKEVAETIFFLSDNDRSSFMTGEALTVDGGATAQLSTE